MTVTNPPARSNHFVLAILSGLGFGSRMNLKAYWITASDETDSVRSYHCAANPVEALADFSRTFTNLSGATIKIEEVSE